MTVKNSTGAMEEISWWRISLGEEEVARVSDAIRGEHLSQGPIVHEFESRLAEYLGVPYVVATTSGSMALLMSYWAAGIGPGDEVIVPDRTWIATAHASVLLGGGVKLVDVESERPIIDAAQIERAITKRTKAIVPVHLNGRSANMPAINELARKHGLRVIEDAAQALGSRNRDGLLGTQSDLGCFSLSVAKIITTGQGGFVATRDKALYEKLIAIRTHGVGSVIDARWTQPGFNFRFTDILASIGIVQLGKIGERLARVREINTRYREALKSLPFLELIRSDLDAGEAPIYVEVFCGERERLIGFLAESGIQSRPFYPDLHDAKYFCNSGAFPNARRFGEEGLFLPSGPGQSEENIDRVITALKSFS